MKIWTRFIPTPKCAKLYSVYKASSETKLDELLHATEVGDERPKVARSHAKANGFGAVPAMLKKFFKSKLPVDVKRAIVANGTKNIDELSRSTDRVLAVDSDLLPLNTRETL